MQNVCNLLAEPVKMLPILYLETTNLIFKWSSLVVSYQVFNLALNWFMYVWSVSQKSKQDDISLKQIQNPKTFIFSNLMMLKRKLAIKPKQ